MCLLETLDADISACGIRAHVEAVKRTFVPFELKLICGVSYLFVRNDTTRPCASYSLEDGRRGVQGGTDHAQERR